MKSWIIWKRFLAPTDTESQGIPENMKIFYRWVTEKSRRMWGLSIPESQRNPGKCENILSPSRRESRRTWKYFIAEIPENVRTFYYQITGTSWKMWEHSIAESQGNPGECENIPSPIRWGNLGECENILSPNRWGNLGECENILSPSRREILENARTFYRQVAGKPWRMW